MTVGARFCCGEEGTFCNTAIIKINEITRVYNEFIREITVS